MPPPTDIKYWRIDANKEVYCGTNPAANLRIKGVTDFRVRKPENRLYVTIELDLDQIELVDNTVP